MLSHRLQKIASLVDKDAKVIDIGTDHAYIPIYLVQNNITKNVLATDISKNVLRGAKENIFKNHFEQIIKTKVSDGFKDIKEKYDIAIITGMGSKTIEHILDSNNIPDTLIIQSNRDLPLLRKFMLEKGYKIVNEEIVYDKFYYDIIKYTKGMDNLSEEEILFGKSNNKEYFKYLKDKYLYIYNKSKREEYLKYINILDKIIERIGD